MANLWPLVIVFVGLVDASLFYGIPPQTSGHKLENAYSDEFAPDYQSFQEPIVEVDENQQPELAPQPNEEEQQSPSEDFYVPTHIGQAAGVAVNDKNQLVIFHRAGREWDEFSFNSENVFNKSLDVIKNNTLTIIDPETGKLIGEHGSDLFFMPHGLSVDSEGNYWVTDVARHQVIKLDRNFKPQLELGEKMVPGNDELHFCKPTDVAVSKMGEIFVADGYCNSRIAKFDKNGRFLGSFGAPNSDPADPKNGEFFVPHSLALIEDLNLLCVADRDNQRIQCFTAGLTPKGAHQRAAIPTGTFVTQARSIGRLMAIREKHHYLVGLTNVDPKAGNEYSVFIMDMNSGKANTFARGIPNAHSLALSESGEIYVGQLQPSQVLKFSIPQPTGEPMDSQVNKEEQQHVEQN